MESLSRQITHFWALLACEVSKMTCRTRLKHLLIRHQPHCSIVGPTHVLDLFDVSLHNLQKIIFNLMQI